MTSRRNKYKKARVQTERERELREYGIAFKKLKRWAEKNNVTLKNFDEADAEDICVLSRDDYEIGDERYIMLQDNESYFLNKRDYEDWENS